MHMHCLKASYNSRLTTQLAVLHETGNASRSIHLLVFVAHAVQVDLACRNVEAHWQHTRSRLTSFGEVAPDIREVNLWQVHIAGADARRRQCVQNLAVCSRDTLHVKAAPIILATDGCHTHSRTQ